MFRFENTVYLRWLWLLPCLWLLWVFFGRRMKNQISKAMGERLAPFLTKSLDLRKRKWKRVLQSLTLIFTILALARPQMGESKEEIKSEGVELMMLVDVSESMMAEDVRPNRLEQVKSEMSRFLEMMPGNKVGVIAFAGSASLLSPLTSDPNSLKLYLDSLSPLSVSTQGTSFQAALAEAEAAFNRGSSGSDAVKTTKVILVASDGEDNEPGALAEAEKLTKEGVRIFTLAYGTEKGAPIPARDNMGFLRGYKKDNKGQSILTTVKGDELRALAQAGKGSFYHASFGGDHLNHLVEDISALEKAQFESEMATQYDEKFQIFLIFALIFGVLEVLLTERRQDFRLWRGRFEVPTA